MMGRRRRTRNNFIVGNGFVIGIISLLLLFTLASAEKIIIEAREEDVDVADPAIGEDYTLDDVNYSDSDESESETELWAEWEAAGEAEDWEQYERYNELDYENYDHYIMNSNFDDEEEELEYVPKLEFELNDDELTSILTELEVSRPGGISGTGHHISLEEHIGMMLDKKYQERLEAAEEGGDYVEDEEGWEWELDDQQQREEKEQQQQQTNILKGEEDRGLRKRTGGTRQNGAGFKRNQTLKGNKRLQNNRFKNKRNEILKNKFGNSSTTGRNKRQFKNVCLDPPDVFRTCYSRTVDPSNTLTACNTVERNGYNLAAQLYKRDRPIPEGLPVPYREPYAVKTKESKTEGQMHVSLFQSAKEMTCDDFIDIEEATLKYFGSSIGDADTFLPACAYIDSNALDQRIARAADGRMITVTSLKIQMWYIANNAFGNQLQTQYSELQRQKMKELMKANKGGLRGRDLQIQRPVMCDVGNHVLCCSQQSINADVGQFCRNLGCDFAKCGSRGMASRPPGRPPPNGRPQVPPSRPGALPEDDASGGTVDTTPARPQRPQRPDRPQRPQRPQRPNRPNRPQAQGTRSLQQQETVCRTPAMENRQFTQVMRQNTAFTTTQLTRSLLNDTDTALVAQCSTNWFAITQGNGIPAVTCEEFAEQDCNNNQDLEFDPADIICLEPSAAPSEAPSQVPSYMPSVSSEPTTSSAPTPSPTEEEED